MPTTSSPPVGAIAYGRSGIGCIITALEANRVILQTPDGLKRVPLDAIARWELPTGQPSESAILKPGDRVRLRGTDQTYTLIEIHEVRDGSENGTPTYCQWAKLETVDSDTAHWKLSQLEGVT